jgi:hypothetical protein
MEQPYFDLDDDDEPDTVEHFCECCEEEEAEFVMIDGEKMWLCAACESGA